MLMSMFFCRIYAAELREHQPNITDAEVDAKLDQDFASWFEKYVSKYFFRCSSIKNSYLLLQQTTELCINFFY